MQKNFAISKKNCNFAVENEQQTCLNDGKS